MKKIFSKILILFALTSLVTSCATRLTKPKGEPQPSKVQFGQFKNVELKEAVIAEKFADDSANKRAAKKINEYLARDMKMIFPNAKLIKKDQDFSKSPSQIPHQNSSKFL